MTTEQGNYYVKQGDTEPALVLYLEDRYGLIPSLSGKSIKFWGWSHASPIYDWLQDRDGSVYDASQGAVQMPWEAGDTDEAGTFHAEVELVSSGGRIETYPAEAGTGQVVQIIARKPKS